MEDSPRLGDAEGLIRRARETQARLASNLKRTYDFIVCGAGASGSVIARRLAENPACSVLLIEAGADDEAESVLDPSQWPTNLGTDRDWPSERTASRGVPAHGWTMFAGLAQPQSRGEVRLRSADPAAPPIVDANMLSDPADLEAARACVRLCRDLGNSQAFQPYVRGEVIPGAGQAADDAFIRDAAVTYWHQCGTARMGHDDLAVVDGSLAVRDIQGLRIADGSILPNVTTGNTQAPCAIIGERAAQILRRQYNL